MLTRKPFAFLALFLLGLTIFSFQSVTQNKTETILNEMIAAVNAHKQVEYTMRGLERIKGMSNLRGGDIFTKINVSPFKVYLKMITDPNKGTEILYVTGERSNKALVNPGRFLPTIKLSPFSSLLSKDQHHIILSSGFTFTAKVTADGMRRAEERNRFDDVFKYVGDVTWNGRSCYKIVIDDPTWASTTYRAQKGENMYTISQKLLIPEYSLVEWNGVKNFEEDLGGRTLKVPTSYAKKTILYIDKENKFPIYQEMQDDKGVFERYEFSGLNVNPNFKADEFSQSFSGYNF